MKWMLVQTMSSSYAGDCTKDFPIDAILPDSTSTIQYSTSVFHDSTVSIQ